MSMRGRSDLGALSKVITVISVNSRYPGKRGSSEGEFFLRQPNCKKKYFAEAFTNLTLYCQAVKTSKL
jgi:hypothetical protein